MLNTDAEMVCLIKPQFEAGREKVGKKGVVRDFSVHKEVIKLVINFALSLNFLIKGLTFSPVKGPEGNIEYLLYIQKKNEIMNETMIDKILSEVDRVVEEAEAVLNQTEV